MSVRGPLRALIAIDTRGAARDALLRWMVLIPIVLALVVRFTVPGLTAALAERFAFDLVPYYPLILGFLLLLVPQFIGLVIGFLLLDQRDDGTDLALCVTPRSPLVLLAYRLLVPLPLGLAITMIVFLTAGTLPFAPAAVLAGALAACLYAPAYGLLIAVLARNKVQGFAVAKVAGLLSVPPILAWFVDEPQQFLFGVVPTYWPMKAWWALQAGNPAGYGYALVGVLALGLMAVLLGRRLEGRDG